MWLCLTDKNGHEALINLDHIRGVRPYPPTPTTHVSLVFTNGADETFEYAWPDILNAIRGIDMVSTHLLKIEKEKNTPLHQLKDLKGHTIQSIEGFAVGSECVTIHTRSGHTYILDDAELISVEKDDIAVLGATVIDVKLTMAGAIQTCILETDQGNIELSWTINYED